MIAENLVDVHHTNNSETRDPKVTQNCNFDGERDENRKLSSGKVQSCLNLEFFLKRN